MNWFQQHIFLHLPMFLLVFCMSSISISINFSYACPPSERPPWFQVRTQDVWIERDGVELHYNRLETLFDDTRQFRIRRVFDYCIEPFIGAPMFSPPEVTMDVAFTTEFMNPEEHELESDVIYLNPEDAPRPCRCLRVDEASFEIVSFHEAPGLLKNCLRSRINELLQELDLDMLLQELNLDLDDISQEGFDVKLELLVRTGPPEEP